MTDASLMTKHAGFEALSLELRAAVEALRPSVDAHITPERVRRYLSELCNTPAPSGAASAFRTPVMKALLQNDGAFSLPGLHLREDFEGSGSTVIMTGAPEPQKKLWYFGHLDTVSYLVQPRRGDVYPLVPFCYHLVRDGVRQARAYRFDLAAGCYVLVTEGEIISKEGEPSFRPVRQTVLLPGDRVVLFTIYEEDSSNGNFIGHMDNAGGAAALAVAAPVLARAGVEALVAFPDEEEGPPGAGNQIMGRGGSRIISLLPPPDLAIVSDVQQAGGDPASAAHPGIENSTRLGQGAVLGEFSSLARGAVTPPHLYALGLKMAEIVAPAGVRIQQSNNAYASRSDDVSVMLKTPNILLIGFPGLNRHFDLGLPRANLHDVVSLAKAIVYYSALAPIYRGMRERPFGSAR